MQADRIAHPFMYFCILLAQFSTKSKFPGVGLVKIYAQAFPSSFPFLGGRIFSKMNWPFLFTIFPPGSFKSSLICVIHTCHWLHQWRPVGQFAIIPTKFTFQMLALGACCPTAFPAAFSCSSGWTFLSSCSPSH